MITIEKGQFAMKRQPFCTMIPFKRFEKGKYFAPITASNIDFFKKVDVFDEEAILAVADFIAGVDVDIQYKTDPFEVQRTAHSFLKDKKFAALFMEMGLGKTIESLAWLQLHPELRPAIVITKASLKIKWARETEIWLSHPKVQILSGTKSSVPITGDILIINYDITPYWTIALKAIRAKAIILDEIHYVKNGVLKMPVKKDSKAKIVKRTLATAAICSHIPHRIGLSGTPLESKPVELINPISIINPTLR